MSVDAVRRRRGEAADRGDSPDSALSSLAELPPDDETPKPVQIVVAKLDHTFELDEEALQEILLSDEVRDRKVVVISVAGAFRKGKSFLLDFLIRYLDREGKEGWMGEEGEALTGFSWRGGIERDTTGILMWSKPFIIPLPNSREEVAVLLLDTQGAFDNQSTVKDCATVFALSTMVSSLQVYNLSGLIQENDLQHLHLFTEYGRLAMEESSGIKPFQSLCCLVRDWSYPYDHEFGDSGGKQYLNKVLEVKEGQHEEIKIVREHIRRCFDRVFAFLLPHPGLKVATNPNFNGQLSDIDSSFKENLAHLVPLLVSGDGLMVKKINGNPVTGSGLLDCFRVYMKIYQSETLPEPKSMLEATAEANNLNAQNAARDRYIREMEKLCGAETPYLATEKLERHHKELTQLCLDQFNSTRKMGGEAFSSQFEEKLQNDITEAYESFLKRNESKHIMNAYRTPAVLVTVMAISYFISSILDMLGIESLSQTAIFGLYIPLLCVLVWGYVRYSGNFRELGQAIDNVTSVVWENALQPLYAKIMEKGLQQAVKIGTGKGKTE